MKSLILRAILFLFPVSIQAGFPEGEKGYDLKKIEESFRYLAIKLEMMIVLREH